ncbi:Aminotransferase class-III, partial [Corchorus capsularis]
MQRFIIPASRRVLSETKYSLRLLQQQRRCFSSQVVAEKEADSESDTNDVVLPKMPPFDYSPPPYTGPSADEILSKRKQYLSPSLFHFYNKPLNIVDGRMQYLFDESGRRYLDAFGGIATVVFFTNSGTEANELAMMIARLYTGCHDIISLRNAYHGNAAGTMGATAQSNWKFNVIQ